VTRIAPVSWWIADDGTPIVWRFVEMHRTNRGVYFFVVALWAVALDEAFGSTSPPISTWSPPTSTLSTRRFLP
jgi:hypothetical protein